MASVRGGLVAVAGLALFLLSFPVITEAQQACAPRPVARIQSVQNNVQLIQLASKALAPAIRDGQVCAGDTIQVGDNSRAVVLMLGSNTPLVIDQNSAFVVTESQTGGRTVIDLLRGALLFLTRIRRSIEIRTPFVNAAIEGTEFVVRVQDDRTVITVFEGIVRASNDAGTIDVGPGQEAVAVKGQAPRIQLVVRPRDAVQWALYYDHVQPASSFAQLAAIPEAARDASFYVRRAGLLLGAGQLDEARSDLDQAQTLDPGNGDADALRTIVAVALNDKAGALTSGQRAVERAPQSAAAQLALSYALQANVQLEAARAAATRATEVTPSDGAAWARLAELHLMLDDLGPSLAAARRAASLSPQLARPHSSLGFALLAQLKTGDARAAFDRAVAAEPDDPMSRLGLGLAKVRQGQLAEGRADIELAVALNPNSSLLRSYLGKAYFDEKREPLPQEQFVLAETFDPLDPTPFFYDAIRKQTLNRPVEALESMERSMDLNDNRTVYRSRLLVDDDSAARGARLGRIYRDLGFENLALLQGSQSMADDPTNFSAHRLLADNYLALPRHEIARDSELLQSQLLQPLNFTPVQPRLADNRISGFDEAGISGIGYNEFTRLFTADQVRVTADVVGGSYGTIGDNEILSAVHRNVSYSVGRSRIETDGVRENNDLTQTIYNGFVQVNLSARTSVQAEFRPSDSTYGDRRLLFDRANYAPFERSKDEDRSIRVGFRHTLSPRSMLIGSVVRNAVKSTITDPGFDFTFQLEETARSIELRHIYRRSKLNLNSGFGYYNADLTEVGTIAAEEYLNTDDLVVHRNAYVYADFLPRPAVTLTAGLSAESFHDVIADRRQLNPKFSAAWTVGRTTVRAAAFRVLKRAFVSSQTIEPTNLAGFNQFFDDTNATDAWRYGVSVNRRISPTVSVGGELSARELKVPTRQGADEDETEKSARAFLYLTPSDRIAIGAVYHYDKDVRDPFNTRPEAIQRMSLHRVPIELRWFHRRGFFAMGRGTGVVQNGMFGNAQGEFAYGSDKFLTVDAAFGYRVPNRRGVLSVEVRNLFDSAFQFQDLGRTDAGIITRSRSVLARLTVAF